MVPRVPEAHLHPLPPRRTSISICPPASLSASAEPVTECRAQFPSRSVALSTSPTTRGICVRCSSSVPSVVRACPFVLGPVSTFLPCGRSVLFAFSMSPHTEPNHKNTDHFGAIRYLIHRTRLSLPFPHTRHPLDAALMLVVITSPTQADAGRSDVIARGACLF